MTLPAQAQGQDGTVPKQERLTACRDEVSRFSDLFMGDRAMAGGRSTTALSGEQKDRLRGLLGEARSAAGKGDPDGCVTRLREARELVRGEGVGRNAPSGRGMSGSSTGSSAGSSAGSSGPMPQGVSPSGAPPSGSAPTGGASGSTGGGGSTGSGSGSGGGGSGGGGGGG
ncbi:hypothetical protein DS843_09515 [Roseomonas genomospecies 6]|uniref:Uncharacterized protein n=2 Tax=Roseomonas genomospecies 6 TaxID=214106 RepID=A0A9W7NLE0_9PROT|nr:hypothetical protein DS843_09515 [Roseomonas genomospecies 6]